MPDTDPLVDVLAEAMLAMPEPMDGDEAALLMKGAVAAVAALDSRPDLVLARLVEKGVLTQRDHDLANDRLTLTYTIGQWIVELDNGDITPELVALDMHGTLISVLGEDHADRIIEQKKREWEQAVARQQENDRG